jgi:glycosyltransferase involved in cell wall biosynthesis
VSRRVLSAIMFSPRGGSSYSARGLAERLPEHGWQATLVAGSRPELGDGTDARVVYRGLDVVPVALAEPPPAPRSGGEAAPLHPSFEDRPGAPDRPFAALCDREYERHASAWSSILERAGAPEKDLIHLHHLTPLNEAAARVAPDVPVVGQLHGTELLMLERIESGGADGWPYADRWRERLREWASRCARLIVAPRAGERTVRLLGVEPEALALIPNGFDPALFRPQGVDRAEHWRRHLVEAPRGSLPGRPPGSAAYREGDLSPLREGVVIAYVGRFTEVKRVPLLIRAFARAFPRFRRVAALALIGGHPEEWEGQHPADAIRAARAENVFLCGWQPHEALPEFLAACDAIVLPSVREQFGQALVEGMACGLPAIAARSFGSRAIVDHGHSGWIVSPDDERAMADALVTVVNDGEERRRRGHAARESVCERFSWSGVSARVGEVFDNAAAKPAPAALARVTGR